MKKDAINIFVLALVSYAFIIGYTPISGIAGSSGRHMFSFNGYCQIVVPSG